MTNFCSLRFCTLNNTQCAANALWVVGSTLFRKESLRLFGFFSGFHIKLLHDVQAKDLQRLRPVGCYAAWKRYLRRLIEHLDRKVANLEMFSFNQTLIGFNWRSRPPVGGPIRLHLMKHLHWGCIQKWIASKASRMRFGKDCWTSYCIDGIHRNLLDCTERSLLYLHRVTHVAHRLGVGGISQWEYQFSPMDPVDKIDW